MTVACQRCGVRLDVGCKHNKPTGDLPASLKAQEQDAKRERYDRRQHNRNQGLHFQRHNLARNLEAVGIMLGTKPNRD